MKLTKTLLAAVAVATFAMPMAATAQTGPNEVIGSISNVVGNVHIVRNGQVLRVVEGSAVMASDKIVAEPGGSGMVNVTGLNGQFTPCSNMLNSGNMVALISGEICQSLSSVMPIGPNDAVLSAAASGNYTGGTIGTAMNMKAFVTVIGAATAAGVTYAILDNASSP